MILPIRYMWEQLDGPQISGISDALFEYWKSVFDEKLDYFNNISVETANNIHLTLLGLLSGLIRPVISEPDREYFYFSEFPEYPSNHGFGDIEDQSVGGRLTRLDVGETIHNVSLDEEHYRALLRAWVSGDGEIGSLVLLDDICAELTRLDLGEETDPFYRFVFMEQDIPVDRAPGDLYLDMRSMDNWHNPTHIYAVLQGLANTAYAPQPRLFISIGSSGSVSPPYFSLPAGSYTGPQQCTITVSVPSDATIYYTLDGSDPTRESPVYTDPITISESCTLKAFAVADNFGDSTMARAVYIIE